MSARRKRHEEHEEHENHERWLVTYADMVTLLMVLFIVMFAMSQVDEKKFAELKEGLAAGFGASDQVLQGASSIQEQPGSAAVAPVRPQLALADLSEKDRAVVEEALAETERLEQDRRRAEARSEAERLDEVRERLERALRAQGLQDDVKATYDERGLVLSLVSRHVVFESDLATLTARGEEVVDTLAPVLLAIPDRLQIDGHTNQVDVQPKYFATDWDLSAARALTVLRRLDERFGVPAERLSLAAYGHEKPLVDPSEPGSQAVNKRVDIVVLTRLPREVAQLLPDAAGALPRDGAPGGDRRGAGERREEDATPTPGGSTDDGAVRADGLPADPTDPTDPSQGAPR
ncbi:MAG: flagellar motor protein MotB [Nocardioides sp.]|uniref:Flagellar motor protein MotB n=1 Tax=Nocardioides kribbensis TaxID=305517 RepID=A0ABV1NX65_9ACTN|nr:flagellar motor protein MotB [Nocardioides kribbensis]MBJ7528881.1 flagellar motor protein MotB [Nocardioides sp.]